MSNNETSDCGCTGDTQRAGADPAYRRALWIVVLLNLGFGVFEAFGGFLADSQALKADALDFIGDGLPARAPGSRWHRACFWAHWALE
jgi:Co/Zn/Cd efflux system component